MSGSTAKAARRDLRRALGVTAVQTIDQQGQMLAALANTVNAQARTLEALALKVEQLQKAGAA